MDSPYVRFFKEVCCERQLGNESRWLRSNLCSDWLKDHEKGVWFSRPYDCFHFFHHHLYWSRAIKLEFRIRVLPCIFLVDCLNVELFAIPPLMQPRLYPARPSCWRTSVMLSRSYRSHSSIFGVLYELSCW